MLTERVILNRSYARHLGLGGAFFVGILIEASEGHSRGVRREGAFMFADPQPWHELVFVTQPEMRGIILTLCDLDIIDERHSDSGQQGWGYRIDTDRLDSWIELNEQKWCGQL